MPFDSTASGGTPRRVFWGPVFVGALACFILQLFLALAAAALGLTLVDDFTAEGIGLGAGLVTALGLFIQFFSAGYLTARLSPQPTRRARFVQGFTVWALVIVGASVLMARGLSAPLGARLGAVHRTTLPVVSRSEASPVADVERSLIEEVAREVRLSTMRAGLVALAALLWTGLASLAGSGVGGRSARLPRERREHTEFSQAA